MPIRELQRWHPYLVHLRLHYQLVFLSPLFAWGFVIGGVDASLGALLGFLSFHVFLYGGITAFNSCFDRDHGPVGGLKKPPPVPRWLLPFSILVQLFGLGLAMTVGAALAALYLMVVVLSVAYSHPSLRWKSRPLLSLLVVALGQGAVGFSAGWVCSAASFSSILQLDGVLGLATASLFTVGLFPLTQLYQVVEDRERGDRTFAVTFGINASFRFAITALVAAGVCMVALAARRFGRVDAAVLTVGYAGLLAVIESWRRHYRAEVSGNFESIHRLQYGLSVAMLGYMIVLWIRR